MRKSGASLRRFRLALCVVVAAVSSLIPRLAGARGEESQQPAPGLGAPLDLVVTDGDNRLAGIKVSVASKDEVLAVGITDEQGHVRLEVPEAELDDLVIEASTPGDEPVTARAKVPPGSGVLRGVLRIRAFAPGADAAALALEADGGDEPEMVSLVRGSVVTAGDAASPAEALTAQPVEQNILADPNEPDTCSGAKVATDGFMETREIGIVSDNDFYKIDLACGDTLRVDVVPTTKELAPLIDFYSDSTCTTILTTAGTLLNGTPTMLLRTVNVAGTYRVRIRANGPNSWGPYTVSFKVTPGVCTPTGEGADSDTCAAPATLGNNDVFDREINPNADFDYYTFNWNCGQILRITVTPTGSSPTLNPSFDLFTPAQAGCIGTPTTVNGTVGQPASTASLLVDPSAAGAWTLRIHSNAGGTGGTYRVSFVIVSTGGLCTADAFEPDNTAAQARPLPATGSSELHNIQQNNLILDEDWFKVNLSCGDRIIVRTLSGAARDAATTVQLRDSSGTTIVATDSTGGGSSFSLLDKTVAAGGLYYVRVSSTTALGSYVIFPEIRAGTKELQVPVTQTAQAGGTQFDAAAKTPSVSYASSTGANPPIDITATGLHLSVGDDTGRGVPLGFPFKIFEDVHSTITVASNGYLTFGNNSTALTNACPIPTAATPNDLIGPMWDDWAQQNGGSLFTQTIGSAPNRQFVAEWDQVPHFSTGGTHTFEAILNESSNTIEFRYGTLSGAAESNGSSASVGVEDVAGARGTSVSCNQAGIIGTNISFALNPATALVNYPAVVTYSKVQPNTPMIDISGSGTNQSLTDESFKNGLALGFTFNYYGAAFTTVSVSANGFASFSTLASASFTNACPLANTAVPNSTVAPFWDDLNPSGANNVFTQTLGAAPTRQFVMQWVNVPFFSGGGSTNFEIIFNEGADTVEFRYGAFSGPAAQDGSSATVGLENAAGTAAHQVSCNVAGFTANGTSYTFTPSAPQVSFTWKNNLDNTTLGTGPSYFAPNTGTCQIRLETSVADPISACPVNNTQNFTLADVSNPAITCKANGAACNAPPPGDGSDLTGTSVEVTICKDFCAESGATATDNCILSNLQLTGSSAGAPTCTGNPCKMNFPNTGDFVYTWTATDAGGNTDTCTSTIHVIRSTNCNNTPTANAGGPYNATCSTATINGATASDPDSDQLTFVWTSSNPNVTLNPATGTIPPGNGPRAVPTATATLASGVAPCGVTATLTLTVTDPFGASATSTATVNFNDNIKPTLSGVPANVTVECSAVPAKANVTVSDNCDTAPTVSFTETKANGSCTDSYTLTRTWTGKDRCGNTVTGTQVITVQDKTAPTLVGVPANVTVECDKVPAPAKVTATDNCDTAPTVTFSEVKTNGSCTDSYTLTRTWTGKDRCGNTKSAVQVITVQDKTAPTLVGVPADVTVECDAVPLPAPVTATDNCNPAPTVSFAELKIDGSCPGNYTLKRTWTAKDRCSNQSSKTQTIMVVDTTAPVVGASADNLSCLWSPNHKYVCFDQAAFVPQLSDNCSEPISWKFAGCASDQCDDAPCAAHPGENGDGNTRDDCQVGTDGSSFCVRAERAGNVKEGRHYAVSIIATDACGNASAPVTIGYVHVPHDQGSDGESCPDAPK